MERAGERPRAEFSISMIYEITKEDYVFDCETNNLQSFSKNRYKRKYNEKIVDGVKKLKLGTKDKSYNQHY